MPASVSRLPDPTRRYQPGSVPNVPYLQLMICQSCHSKASGLLCPRCRAQLRSAADRVVVGHLLRSAFIHTGPAASLMHGLKYRGLLAYADVAAVVLAPKLPVRPIAPIPRVWTRRTRYGVDPAREIAVRVARLTGVPIIDLFARPLHGPRRAGQRRTSPPKPFRLQAQPEEPILILDDVVTSGATMSAAVSAVGSRYVAGLVAANDALVRSTLLSMRVPSHSRSPGGS